MTPKHSSPSLHRASADAPFLNLDPLVRRRHLREPVGQSAAGLASSGVHDAPGRVPAFEAEGERTVRVLVEAHAVLDEPLDRRRRRVDEGLHRVQATQAASSGKRVLRVAFRRVIG